MMKVIEWILRKQLINIEKKIKYSEKEIPAVFWDPQQPSEREIPAVFWNPQQLSDSEAEANDRGRGFECRRNSFH